MYAPERTPARRTALVRRPGPRLAEGIAPGAAAPVDTDLARRQHDAYVAALRAAGWTVHEVEPADDHPDAVFVQDALVVRGDVAVVTRPGAPARRGETAGAEKAARDLGLRVERVTAPATLDGGDVLQAGGVVYVGRTARTNEDGTCALAHLLGDGPVVPVAAPDVLHLKSAMTALPDGTLFGRPEHVATAGLPGVRVAPEPTGAHVLVTGPRHVLLAASAPRTAALLAAEGLDVTTVEIGEFQKLGGSVTCLSVLIP
ncbi:dimethylarginine dimethylaminohydrolase family protein [Actinomadura flavalba]|uniref:dimethylarginine dimethylaminohydrolase family protein n=1 Tax=Actinomadura flavalba TaxID=1120938 RepID=UPI00037FB98A|nr:hypothetical protein [Actinomadura flavalba]